MDFKTDIPITDGFEAPDDLIEAMEAAYVEPEGTLRFPLNIREIVTDRFRGLGEDRLKEVITAAGIMYWNTGESRTMLQSLFLATEYVRSR